ncbi:unnamed protein product [marine sediment metagenome]|uniref:Uncharacterized protein n=1 Tax=marine sediment metagenome TaxID=412755 RepID=X1S2L1_9ZZZZ
MTENKIVTITPYSEEWRRCMANANRSDKEFMPLRFKGKKLSDLKELLAKEKK